MDGDEDVDERLVQFPLSRIKKHVKYDPAVKGASSEAIFLIAKATEIFIYSLAKESYTFTASDGKRTMMKKHVESAINDIDALAFLDGTID